jgi:exodeoxyribonuclease-5
MENSMTNIWTPDTNKVPMSSDEITPTEEQFQAIKEIKKWFNTKKNRKPYFSMLGVAGTGKSSIIPFIIDELKLNENTAAVCSFTGKAALVLKRRGISFAKTIHQTIYDIKINVLPDGKKEVVFRRKKRLDKTKLIIVDEASMIDQKIHNDLSSYRLPILYIGDPFQLPPISGNWNVMEQADFEIKTILRQAKENPIIRAADLIRRGEIIPYCSSELFTKIPHSKFEFGMLKNYEQIAVGKNNEREEFNNRYRREILNIHGNNPQPGEKLVVLHNNYFENLFNGQCVFLGEHCSMTKQKNQYYYHLEYIDELELTDVVCALTSNGYKHGLFTLGLSTDDFSEHEKDIIHADFGYALTVHKMQGSQWNSVAVFDKGFGIWQKGLHERWLYTAITRAKEKVLIVSGK